jgi:hypothetical protein
LTLFTPHFFFLWLSTSIAPWSDEPTETLRRRYSISRRRQCSLLLGFFLYTAIGLLPLQYIARGDRIFSASSPSLRRRRANSGECFLLVFTHVSLQLLSGNLPGLNLL